MSGKDSTEYQEIDLDGIDENDTVELEQPDDGKRVMQSGGDQERIIEGSDDEVEIIDDAEDQGEDEQAAKKAKEEEPKPKRKNRAQQRIRKLSQERNQLREENERLRQATYALEDRAVTQKISSAKSQRNIVAKRLQDLAAAQARALEEGDYNKHAQLGQEVADQNLRLRVLDYEANNVPPKRQAPPPRQQQPEIPDAGQDWLEDNTWMLQPKTRDEAIKRQVATIMADELIAEGQDPNDPGFYDELDTRLAAQLGGSQQKPPAQEHEEKEAPRVAGTGRQAPARRSTKGGKIRLTREDMEMCEVLGITPQEYAKQKANQEDGGWSEIT
jgi:hypothetical protein